MQNKGNYVSMSNLSLAGYLPFSNDLARSLETNSIKRIIRDPTGLVERGDKLIGLLDRVSNRQVLPLRQIILTQRLSNNIHVNRLEQKFNAEE